MESSESKYLYMNLFESLKSIGFLWALMMVLALGLYRNTAFS